MLNLPPIFENPIILTFVKVKTSHKTGLILSEDPVWYTWFILAFLYGFPSLHQVWHTSQGFQKADDELQKKTSLKRTTNKREAAKEDVPCS